MNKYRSLKDTWSYNYKEMAFYIMPLKQPLRNFPNELTQNICSYCMGYYIFQNACVFRE